MLQAGRSDVAQADLYKLIDHAKAQNDHYKLADLNLTASQISRAQNDISAALAYLNEALRQAAGVGYKSVVLQIENGLADLYRLT